MAEHIKVLVVMNGIRYEQEEARQVVENTMERSSIQYERVELIKSTPAKSTKASKKSTKTTKKKSAAKKRKKKSED